MNILVTGAAGFIGMHICKLLLNQGLKIHGLDNLSDYYDVSLKRSRLELLASYKNFAFTKMDICERGKLQELFFLNRFDKVVHLAAQAGVRYSIENPHAYIDSNIVGFVNLLEACKSNGIKHLVYASSSSVYGGNTKTPFSEDDNVDRPVSLYAATKKANELMAYTYSHLYQLPTTGVRFFTVYGPWGRPDMALFRFVKAILNGEAIDIFNFGKMKRDFTYIDDIAEGLMRVLDSIPSSDPQPSSVASAAPYRILNMGNQNPVALMDFVSEIEKNLDIEAKKNFLPLQDGDVLQTYSDTKRLQQITGHTPNTSLSEGVSEFVRWYRSYYRL